MSTTYSQYLDELLLAVAARQTGSEVELVNLAEIHEERFADCPDTWLQTAATELAQSGYGYDWQDTSNLTFRITGGGLRRAETIRTERKRKTVFGWLKATVAEHWIALLALVFSIIAILWTPA